MLSCHDTVLSAFGSLRWVDSDGDEVILAHRDDWQTVLRETVAAQVRRALLDECLSCHGGLRDHGLYCTSAPTSHGAAQGRVTIQLCLCTTVMFSALFMSSFP